MAEPRLELELRGRFEQHRIGETVVYYDPEPHRYFSEIRESKSGVYHYVRGSNLIGCSTPVKALDTNVDPLMHWAVGLDQVGIAELASICLDSGDSLDWLRNPKSIAAALRDAELTWDKVRDRTATRGTRIHELIFLALATDSQPPSLASLEAEERGYGQAAIRWWMDRRPEPVYAEQVTADLDNRVAGRFDLLCDVDGERLLVDAKTREGGRCRRSDHAQLAGYELCNVACGIGPSDRQVALILKPDGTYEEHTSVATTDDFIAALNAYRRGGDLEKRRKAAEKAQVAA